MLDGLGRDGEGVVMGVDITSLIDKNLKGISISSELCALLPYKYIFFLNVTFLFSADNWSIYTCTTLKSNYTTLTITDILAVK